MKKLFSFIFLTLLFAFTFTLTSCNNKIQIANVPVERDTQFQACYVKITNEDFQRKGFKYGDSCDVTFTNGKELLDIPYYSGYYAKFGEPLIVYYQGYPYVAITENYGSNFFDKYELSENVGCTITLNERGKYLTYQNTFSLSYSNDRNEYTSDEAFANFRPMNLPKLKENLLYRGASPFNNVYNRADTVSKLLEKNGIKYIIDLADSDEDIQAYQFERAASSDYPYSYQLYDDCCISLLDMGPNYTSREFKESLAVGITEMLNFDGPYYIHCTEGKDRTGFVCFLLECLVGSTYEEMKDDYMVTFCNYYKIDKSSEKYQAVVELNFDAFLENITGLKGHNPNDTYANFAENYLIECGLKQEVINALISKIKK